MRTLVITTGDTDGIGWEVTAKALLEKGPSRGLRYIVFRSERASNRWSSSLNRNFRRCVISDLNDLPDVVVDRRLFNLIEWSSSLGPPLWVELAARLCLSGAAHGLVTAPLSKTSIHASGLKDLGHTDILRRVSGARDVRMAFVGSSFNVVLASGHVPLAQVPRVLSEKSLRETLRLALAFRTRLPRALRGKPIGLLGLNPHSGEDGLIGREELSVFRNVLSSHRGAVVGPLVPDAAFQRRFWGRYSMYVAPYHDQGLIPFKMIHGQSSGAHLTLGLPFVRTSVDHGTAKDLFGKNKADCGSMLDALSWADSLTKERT